MQTKLKTAAATILAFIMAASTIRAGAVDPKYVPSDAKWVVHVDVDAVAKSKMLQMLDIDLKLTGDGKHFMVGARPNGMTDNDVAKIAAIQDALGMKFPDDLHGLTLAGRSFDEKGVVLVIKAKLDKDRIIGMAKISPGYTSKMYNGTEISTFKQSKSDSDEDGVSGAFVGSDALVIGRTPKDVEHAIDTIGDKDSDHAAALVQGGSSLSNGAVMVYLAADGLAELQKEEDLSPIIAPVKNVRAAVSEREDDIVLKAELNVKTAEAARQVRGALEGVRALATLATLDNNGDKAAKMITQLASRATVSVNDTTVTVDWPVAMSTIRDAIKPGKRHATSQPAASGETQPESSDGNPAPTNAQ